MDIIAVVWIRLCNGLLEIIHACICVYMYVHTCTYMYLYIYNLCVYPCIVREQERERERGRALEAYVLHERVRVLRTNTFQTFSDTTGPRNDHGPEIPTTRSCCPVRCYQLTLDRGAEQNVHAVYRLRPFLLTCQVVTSRSMSLIISQPNSDFC